MKEKDRSRNNYSISLDTFASPNLRQSRCVGIGVHVGPENTTRSQQEKISAVLEAFVNQHSELVILPINIIRFYFYPV